MQHVSKLLLVLILVCWWTFVVDRRTTMPPGDFIRDYEDMTTALAQCKTRRAKVLKAYRDVAPTYDTTGQFVKEKLWGSTYIVGPCLPGGLDRTREWYRWGPTQWLPAQDR